MSRLVCGGGRARAAAREGESGIVWEGSEAGCVWWACRAARCSVRGKAESIWLCSLSALLVEVRVRESGNVHLPTPPTPAPPRYPPPSCLVLFSFPPPCLQDCRRQGICQSPRTTRRQGTPGRAGLRGLGVERGDEGTGLGSGRPCWGVENEIEGNEVEWDCDHQLSGRE